MQRLNLFICVALLFVYASGEKWFQLSSGPWGDREGHMAVSFDGFVYLVGGRNDFSTYNDVYRSQDGVSWEMVLEHAPFQTRGYHQLIVHRGFMYVLGGQTFSKFHNDIWRSKDGKNWELVLENAPWRPRAGLAAIDYQGDLYLLGGGYNNLFRKLLGDVWKSVDGGFTWEKILDSAPWVPRSGARLVVHNDRLLLLGGENGFSNKTQFHDVWSTTDGHKWIQELGEAPWSNRSGHGVVEYKGSIYLIAGYIQLHDMWKSNDGKDWTLIDNTVWNCQNPKCGRYDFWSLVHTTPSGKDLLLVLGGSSSPTTFFDQHHDTWGYVLGEKDSTAVY